MKQNVELFLLDSRIKEKGHITKLAILSVCLCG